MLATASPITLPATASRAAAIESHSQTAARSETALGAIVLDRTSSTPVASLFTVTNSSSCRTHQRAAGWLVQIAFSRVMREAGQKGQRKQSKHAVA